MSNMWWNSCNKFGIQHWWWTKSWTSLDTHHETLWRLRCIIYVYIYIYDVITCPYLLVRRITSTVQKYWCIKPWKSFFLLRGILWPIAALQLIRHLLHLGLQMQFVQVWTMFSLHLFSRSKIKMVWSQNETFKICSKKDSKKSSITGGTANGTGSMAPVRPLPTTTVPVLERGAVTVVKAEGYVARLGASNRPLGMPVLWVFYNGKVMESGGFWKAGTWNVCVFCFLGLVACSYLSDMFVWCT